LVKETAMHTITFEFKKPDHQGTNKWRHSYRDLETAKGAVEMLKRAGAKNVVLDEEAS